MAAQFIRDTPYILPPCVQDYLPEDPMARFVVDIADQESIYGPFSALNGVSNAKWTRRSVRSKRNCRNIKLNLLHEALINFVQPLFSC